LATEALALDGVDALYGESHVLHGVSFALGEGRVLALLGRNGAGKTTCMNTVIGFLTPRSGSVRVFDLFPRLKERQAQDAGSLSGGEQQMLAIARALMGNPRVLLLDEPSEGLAPLIVAEVGRTIARLKSEGQSIVLVEQNIKLAFSLADDVVILNTGRVAFGGPVDQVKADEALITQHLGVF
jgi:branched-chain amino acid transport system ATP-binding protein